MRAGTRGEICLALPLRNVTAGPNRARKSARAAKSVADAHSVYRGQREGERKGWRGRRASLRSGPPMQGAMPLCPGQRGGGRKRAPKSGKAAPAAGPADGAPQRIHLLRALSRPKGRKSRLRENAQTRARPGWPDPHLFLRGYAMWPATGPCRNHPRKGKPVVRRGRKAMGPPNPGDAPADRQATERRSACAVSRSS